jgi:hypothetical protein
MEKLTKEIKSSLLAVICSILIYPAFSQEMGNHVASWIGNTGNTGGDGAGISGTYVKGRLQNQVRAIAVTPGGVVFAAGRWDEAHLYLAAYQDGKLIGRFPGLKDYYVDGSAIATNGNTTIVSISTGGNGYIKKYNTTTPSAPTTVGSDVLVTTAWNITGLCMVGDFVYVSDKVNNKIKVYKHTDMTYQREFNFSNPGAITYDGTYLWIVDLVTKEVERWTTAGAYQSHFQLASSVIPDDIAYASGKIYVADMGAANNVKVYNTSGTSAGTWGSSLFSGTRGAYAPGKFAYLTGIDFDSSGNFYISTDFQQSPYPFNSEKPRGGYTNIESYTAASTGTSLTLRWSMYDWSFIEVAVPDPDNENILYTGRHYYEMDYSKGIGQEVVGKGVTWDPTLYPNDTRSKDDLYTVIDVKKVNGVKYLFCSGMYNGNIDVYKWKSTDGKIASPAGTVNSGFTNTPWARCVDSQGNIWYADATGGIKKFTANTTLDANGNPTWSNSTTIPMPAPFTAIRRIEYDVSKDAMFIFGYTADYPNDKNFWGKAVGRRMARYNNWSTGNRTASWVSGDFLYHKIAGLEHGDSFIAAADISADYIFLQYSHQLWYANNGTNTPNRQYLEVYRKSDGSKVGYMQPSPEADLGWAQVDIPYGMRAMRRTNGQYLIFVEDDWFHKVIMYKWTPGTAGRVSAPELPDVEFAANAGLSVYPNPASSTVKLLFNTKAAGKATVTIVNQIGQPVYTTERAVSEGQNELEVAIHKLPSGVYVVKLQVGNNLPSTAKLIRE